MNISKQIVDNQVINLVEQGSEYIFESKLTQDQKISKAFLALSVAAYLETEIADILEYITDGGDDGGFDAAYVIEEENAKLNVILFQTKYTKDLNKDSNFSANAIEKAVNTLKSIFDPKKQLRLNPLSKTIIDDIHSYLVNGYIPYVTFVCINNGLKWDNSAQNIIDNNFAGQKQVVFEYFNHENIIERNDRKQKVNATIKLKGKAIHEDYNYKSVTLGRANVLEIHRLMKEHGNSLLEKNIRRFLGHNPVNDGIKMTLVSDDNRNNFFFFNNGITVICKNSSANYLQDTDWIVLLEDMQIINGGQTCKTIFQTVEENPALDYTNTDVLVRIYEIHNDENIVQEITYATNSQNPVDFRDLKSNDIKQILLEKSSLELGWTYRRKREYFSATNGSIASIPSSVAAEAVLAIWRDSPHLAKYKKNEFFNSYYNKIFTDLNAAQMITAVLIFRYCDSARRRKTGNPEIDIQRAYSHHFIAMIIGKLILRDNGITLDSLTHKNFFGITSVFTNNGIENIYQKAELMLLDIIYDFTGRTAISDMDGRTISGLFRGYGLVELCLERFDR